jgi:RNA polymerase sigma-70 factor (ECF subfamily)
MGAASMRNGNATNRTTTENERKLLAAVARRDRQAFARLYRIYQPRLYGYLRRFAANPVVVEEVVDDVMFVVWTDAKKFRGKSAVSSWIFGIAYRKALTALRREGRYEAPLRRDVETVDPNSVSRADIELIQAGLAGLSPDHRQVIELTYFCGYSYQEIAEIADCPVNTVKTRMFHARRRLKVLLPRLAGENTEQKHDQL